MTTITIEVVCEVGRRKTQAFRMVPAEALNDDDTMKRGVTGTMLVTYLQTPGREDDARAIFDVAVDNERSADAKG